MTTATDTAQPQQRQTTYGQWRRPRSAGLLGLGTYGTAAGLVGIILVLFTLMIAWRAALALAGALLVVFAPLMIHVGGHTGAQALTARAAWWRGYRHRQRHYLAGVVSPLPTGRHTLPGLLAASHCYRARDAYDREFGLIHIPTTGHYTAVLRADADGASLVDRDQIDEWVAGWGSWLAGLAHEPGLEAATVTIETAPDSGERLRAEVDRITDPDAPELARRVLAETAQTYPAGSAATSTRVALTYHAARSGGTRSTADMAVDIGTRLPALADALAAAGAGGARPLDAGELADIAYTAYDPTTAVDADRARHEGGTGLDWQAAGPSAQRESWDRLRHDSGLSVTWAMEEAPRGAVLSSVLTQLLGPHHDVPRKRVTLVYRPHGPGAAAKLVDEDLRDARFLASRRQVARARDDRDVRAALQSTQEEAAGAGLVRFSVLVTATVDGDDPDAYRQACSTVGDLASTARLRLRRCYGAQSAAFAAGLGLGVVLPAHLMIPTELREEL